jgi:hypothetical protein
MKGFTALYDELLAIKPQKPEAYHPIPTDVRETAYKFSPTFASLKGPLEGPALELYAPMARANDGIVNDYGTFFFWGLRVAPWYERQWTDAESLDRMYARCAAELRKARESGAYPSRRVYASYVDPDCSLWLPHLGEGMKRYAGMLTRTDVEMLNPEAPDVNAELFDRAALRRAALVKSNAAIGTNNPDRTVKTLKNALATVSAYATYGAVLLLVPTIVILIVGAVRRFDEKTAMVTAAIVLVIVTFASRFMLMSVMHASAYHAETRYILPVAPLTGLAFAIFLAVALEELTHRHNRGKDTSND